MAEPSDRVIQQGQHEYKIRPITIEEIERTDHELSYAGMMLQRTAGEALGWDVITIEAQLRWEDYLAQLAPEERDDIVERRQMSMEKAIEAVESDVE